MVTNQLSQLREMKARRPFSPFRIVTTQGDKYLVENRFQVAVSETKAMYVYPASDRFVELSANQIAAVELIEQKPAA